MGSQFLEGHQVAPDGTEEKHWSVEQFFSNLLVEKGIIFIGGGPSGSPLFSVPILEAIPFFSAPFSVSRLYFSVALSQLLDKPVNATMDPF